ncbi:hypothetical protein Tco_0664323 [Tanacetum coccineum]
MKFLFIYGIGEVVVKNGDQGYLIPGVHYAPEVTLNILSIEQLERQGFDIIYEDNTCRLSYMFSNPNDHKLNEDKLRVMQNEFLENYFDSLEKGDTTAAGMKTDGMLSMDNDLIEIKGTTYSTKMFYQTNGLEFDPENHTCMDMRSMQQFQVFHRLTYCVKAYSACFDTGHASSHVNCMITLLLLQRERLM